MAEIAHMMPSSIADRLRRLVETRDRHQPVAFVGRKDELRHLQGVVDVMRAGPVKGALRVVQGAPGTGKTSLCGHFQDQLIHDDALRAALAQGQEDSGLHAPVLCADLSCADLAKIPLDLVRTISQRIGETLQSASTRSVEDKLGVSAQVGGALRASLGLLAQKLFRGKSWDDIREATFGLNQRSSLEDCVNAYVDHAWPPDCAIALCMDEAQNCDVESGQAKENLQALCAGEHRGRLPLLCFGLANTIGVLDQMGVSRPPDDAVRTLACLNPGEGLQAIERTLDALGLSGSNRAWSAHLESLGMTAAEWDSWRARTAAELADASGEFPQHVATALISLGESLLGMDTGQRFDDALRQDVLAKHQERRIAYYEGRLGSAALARHRLALGAICELLHRRSAQGGNVMRAESVSLLKLGDDDGQPVQNARDVLDAAVARGVLGQTIRRGGQGRTGLAVITGPPIQSMQTHLRDVLRTVRLDAPEAAQTLMRRVDELAPMAAPDANPSPEAQMGK